MESLLRYLGPALVLLRKRAGMRQYELARHAGITRPMLSAYETSKQHPTLVTLARILGGLNATLADLHDAVVLLTNHQTSEGTSPAPRLPALGRPPASQLPIADDVEIQRFYQLQAFVESWLNSVRQEVLGRAQRMFPDGSAQTDPPARIGSTAGTQASGRRARRSH